MMNNYGDPRFNSPPMGVHRRDRYQSTPTDIFQQNNSFQRNRYSGSPGYSDNHPNMHLSRNLSPYRPHRKSSRSFNNSATSSPDQWNRSNQSSSSGGYSAYISDSPFRSPIFFPIFIEHTQNTPLQNLERRYQVC